ncbi:MAG: response regulator [Pseudomonadota bacterium]
MTDLCKPVEAGLFRSEAMAGHGITVLVIDDHKELLDVLGQGLALYGYAVLTASSGQEGLRLFRENHVDMILCDLGMPHMDGWEVAKGICDTCNAQGLKKPRLILVTAWADQIKGDRRIRKLGIDAVVGKPVSLNTLLLMVEREIARKNGAAVPALNAD